MVASNCGQGDLLRWRGLLVGAAALLWASPAPAEEWKVDVIYLTNGHQFSGLIVTETKESIHFKNLIRKPGLRTVVIDIDFSRDEIQRIDRLTAEERKELVENVAQLDRGGERERARIKAVHLQPATWPSNEPARLYEGKYFTLISNAREDIVRQVAVRLDDMFQAYVDTFGARRQPQRPTQIILCRSLKEYRERLQAAGLNVLLNPACYDPKKNQILAATDLEERTDEIERLRQKHEVLLQELDAQDKKLRRHFNGQPPRVMLDQLCQTRRSIQQVSAENESAFERLKLPLLTILAHEAFHAYLENHVYPVSEGGLPHWLNEGLAQIFESSVMDGNTLRFGRVDEKRLVAMQDAIRQKQAVSLAELLQAEPRQYQLAHQSEALLTDRLFLASWALSYYLAFDRKLIKEGSLEPLLASLQRGTNKLEAFRAFTGQPLGEFEAQFHQYVMNLRPDGSVKMTVKN